MGNKKNREKRVSVSETIALITAIISLLTAILEFIKD